MQRNSIRSDPNHINKSHRADHLHGINIIHTPQHTNHPITTKELPNQSSHSLINKIHRILDPADPSFEHIPNHRIFHNTKDSHHSQDHIKTFHRLFDPTNPSSQHIPLPFTFHNPKNSQHPQNHPTHLPSLSVQHSTPPPDPRSSDHAKHHQH